MGNRCPDCNKFVSLETEAEEEGIDVSGASVDVQVRVVRNCAECSTEMKDNSFSNSVDIPVDWLAEHSDSNEGHGDYEAELQNLEATESGGGRYAKNMIGFEATVKVTCKCGEEIEIDVSDEDPASYYNDLN